MTTTLPTEIQQVFDRFITTEYTTVDASGQPITWPVTPYHDRGHGTIDVTTGLGYPKKARDAQRNPKVSLLFSDPNGSGLDAPAAVLVQGTADVDDRNLEQNRKRYYRESREKLPAVKGMYPPPSLQRLANWYFTRIYVHVRPERIYVWDRGDFASEPELFDSHMEEVRSTHSEEPEVEAAAEDRTSIIWDERMGELGTRFPSAVLSVVGPDGFPVAGRVPISVDHQRRLVNIGRALDGLPVSEGRACLCAHEHDPKFRWQVNFQVRGNLHRREGSWSLEPHKLVGGFELPPSGFKKVSANARKVLRFRKIAKQEMKRGSDTGRRHDRRPGPRGTD